MKSLKKSDYRFFEEARKCAMRSGYPSFKIGCVLVYKNHLIGCGWNSTKTCPQQKYYNRRYRNFRNGTKPIMDSIHAEMAAIRSVPIGVAEEIEWGKVSAYIYRISPGKESGHGLAIPCGGCMHAIIDQGIRTIYYTTDEGYAKTKVFE